MAEDTKKRVDYTPITQALRAAMDSDGWANSTTYCVKLSADMDTFNALCDDIDALHKSLERKNAGMRDFCERVEQAAQAREDVTLWGVDYTALPLDADGVPIHIGDVMEWCDSGEKLTVEGIGIDVLFYIDGENAEWTAARNKHHHHEPTVEDVLREMADRCYADEDEPRDRDAIVAEYAAKLRLAGDAE